MRDLLGLLACVVIAAGCGEGSGDTGCGEDSAEPSTWECWDEPVSSEWATDTNWQSVTLEGESGSRTVRIRTRGDDHPYSVDLETVVSSGEVSSTQLRAHVQCEDQSFYYSNWVDSTDLQNPGCPYPIELLSTRAQIRSAHCQ